MVLLYKKAWFFVLLFAIAVLAIGAIYCVALPFMRENQRWHKDVANQMEIAKAVVAYKRQFGIFPDSISRLVEAKFLPEKAKFYSSPYHDQEVKEISFTISSYQFSSEKRLGSGGHYITRIQKTEQEGEDGFHGIDEFIKTSD